ncbi:efflux RND transporter periplasmic adaptor subunit [Bradyrhizobium jicamae]|uniref:efflux RND transporter periplasmic adaptor subunit n=1 Tax=Bradyrhizobium jicamae TaxID=280332 RepID=UPI001BA57540|nr:efflux RND transporter periplasmic adaptor subunit [Bradyrhizobium jicamae]MBR0751251.1 efflux RND transporter periplasmic adaptor subunit [Bradyrhizobium jicamae]
MNYNGPINTGAATETDRVNDTPAPVVQKRGRRGRLMLLGVVVVFTGSLTSGAWNHLTQYRLTAVAAEAERNLVPQVRLAAVAASGETQVVRLPATTSAFASANIFARASGYVGKREVDIGDRVKAGQLLAEIVAPELDHQIAQAEATLAQLKFALQQAEANRELAKVTWDRDRPLVDKGWVTGQQGTIDQQNLKAQEAAVQVAQANVTAEEAQVQVLHQQKVYQQVVAPFDGVITQRNIDVGSLVQADATSGTFMFNLMQGNVIRTQVFVPQDQAFGLEPGIEAVVHVPEIPDRSFPGKVTRIADAIQPGSRTLLAEIDIPNPDGALKPGIYCTIELHIPRKSPSFQISADAIIFNEGGTQVAVVENGVVHLRKVNVVRDFGQRVDIDRGVKAGDEVILNPPVDLAEGSKVKPRRPTAQQMS